MINIFQLHIIILLNLEIIKQTWKTMIEEGLDRINTYLYKSSVAVKSSRERKSWKSILTKPKSKFLLYYFPINRNAVRYGGFFVKR